MFALQPADLEFAPITIVPVIILAAMLQDDLTCSTVGVFAANGNLSLPVAWAACFVGTLLGDLMWFLLARWCGPVLISRAPLKWIIKPQQLDLATGIVERYGSLSIFLCRFLPGIRTPLQLMIGALHPNPGQAVTFFAVAASVYTLLIFGLCLAFQNALNVMGIFEQYRLPGLMLAAAVVLLIVWAGKRCLGVFTEFCRNREPSDAS